MNNADNAELLLKIARGDSIAFSVLFKRYHSKMIRFSNQILKSNELANEVVQEVMLKLWMMGYRVAEIDNFDGWLRTMTRNRSIDILRREKRILTDELKQEHVASDTEINFTEEYVLLQEARNVLEQGIMTLPEQQRTVYQLTENEGLTAEEISVHLNLKISTVHTHLKLARKSLRSFLLKHYDLVVSGILLNFFL